MVEHLYGGAPLWWSTFNTCDYHVVISCPLLTCIPTVSNKSRKCLIVSGAIVHGETFACCFSTMLCESRRN